MGENSIVHKNAKIGKNVKIGPSCLIGEGVEIGDNCELLSFVNISGNTKIGSKNKFFPFSKDDISFTRDVQHNEACPALIFVTNEARSTAVYVTPSTTPVFPTIAPGHSIVTPFAFLENWP